MVLGRPSALYDDLLRDWRRIVVQVTPRVRTEVVWLDFEPGRMHSAGDVGRNRTDRQRIKRKAGYRKMPPGERQAMLAAIMTVEAG